jgi:hypothetical protein
MRGAWTWGCRLPSASPDAGGTDGILVPAQAVVPSATGHSVFVVRDGRAEQQEVQIGLRTRESVEVLRGLAIGDTVITSNLLRLRPGMRIEPEVTSVVEPEPHRVALLAEGAHVADARDRLDALLQHAVLADRRRLREAPEALHSGIETA